MWHHRLGGRTISPLALLAFRPCNEQGLWTRTWLYYSSSAVLPEKLMFTCSNRIHFHIILFLCRYIFYNRTFLKHSNVWLKLSYNSIYSRTTFLPCGLNFWIVTRAFKRKLRVPLRDGFTGQEINTNHQPTAWNVGWDFVYFTSELFFISLPNINILFCFCVWLYIATDVQNDIFIKDHCILVRLVPHT